MKLHTGNTAETRRTGFYLTGTTTHTRLSHQVQIQSDELECTEMGVSGDLVEMGVTVVFDGTFHKEITLCMHVQ